MTKKTISPEFFIELDSRAYASRFKSFPDCLIECEISKVLDFGELNELPQIEPTSSIKFYFISRIDLLFSKFQK